MSILLLVISTAITTWGLLYFFVYGHKAQINKLWKEIFRYAHETAKLKKMIDEVGSATIFADSLNALRIKENKAGKLIDALLDYHYGDIENEDEQEYAKNNYYEEKT